MAVGTGLIHQEANGNQGLRAATAVLAVPQVVLVLAVVAVVLLDMRALGATVVKTMLVYWLPLEQAVVVVVVLRVVVVVVAVVLGVEAGHLR
jgi:hypothetical protein